MANEATIALVAGQACDWFETRKRDSDSEYVTLKDGRPEWLYELVKAAHGEMLPDDWRYATIRAALGFIYDNEPTDLQDAGYEFTEDAVDVYSSDLVAWLGSNLARAGYCNEAADEGLIGNDVDVMRIIAEGQKLEALEVWQLVTSALVEYVEGLEVA